MNDQSLLNILMQSQYWSTDKLMLWQNQALSTIVQHAVENCKFYKNRFPNIISENGSVNRDRWEEIPILTREDVVHNYDGILSRSPPQQHGPFSDVRSSGATGDPVKVRTSDFLLRMSASCNWRSQSWHGIDWSKTLINQLYVDSKISQATLRPGVWGPPWIDVARRGKIYVTPKSFTALEMFETMLSVKPDYVSIGTGIIPELARLAADSGKPISISAFFSRGSAAEPHIRAQAAEVFGASILELYSSKEGGSLAHPCPSGKGFHVNEEAVLLEIVDDDGHAVLPGREGRVVITPFCMTAFPLVRYDQGDRAVRGGMCACGRTLGVIDKILGRSTDVFRHPDGRAQFGPELISHLRPLIGARRWQVAQIGATTYEVRLPEGEEYNLENLDAFRAEAQLCLFGDALVKIIFVADLKANAAGKFREYVREMKI
jgi:phenylacetate-CoA ligase